MIPIKIKFKEPVDGPQSIIRVNRAYLAMIDSNYWIVPLHSKNDLKKNAHKYLMTYAQIVHGDNEEHPHKNLVSSIVLSGDGWSQLVPYWDVYKNKYRLLDGEDFEWEAERRDIDVIDNLTMTDCKMIVDKIPHKDLF